MDKTKENFEPHKMWDLSREITDLIALIGATKSKNLPIPIEHFKLLVEKCDDLYELSEEFLEYAKDRDNK